MYTEVNDNPNLFGCESQNQMILDYLKQGETLTSLEALLDKGLRIDCFRLPSRMCDLKEKDVKYDSVYVKKYKVNPKTGKIEHKNVKAYFIPEFFAKKYKLDPEDTQYLRTFAKEVTESRINVKK